MPRAMSRRQRPMVLGICLITMFSMDGRFTRLRRLPTVLTAICSAGFRRVREIKRQGNCNKAVPWWHQLVQQSDGYPSAVKCRENLNRIGHGSNVPGRLLSFPNEEWQATLNLVYPQSDTFTGWICLSVSRRGTRQFGIYLGQNETSKPVINKSFCPKRGFGV